MTTTTTNSSINYGEIIGSLAVLAGIFYGMKKNSGLMTTAVYAVAFGIVGGLAGNSIGNFFQSQN